MNTLRLICLLLFSASYLAAQAPPDSGRRTPRSTLDRPTAKGAASFPYVDGRIHRNGLLWTTINNNGIIGNIFNIELPEQSKTAPTFYYPMYSRIQHGYYAALWVGGVVAGDTLVSTAMDSDWSWWHGGWPMEFWPDEYPFGEIKERSSNPNSEFYDSRANADVEFEAVYADTFERQSWLPYNPYDLRDHKSMGLVVTQNSYSWPYKYAADFIIVDYNIENVREDTIYDAWVGLYYVGCVLQRSEQPYPPSDDLEGYIYSVEAEMEECGEELLQSCWIVDNDGRSFSFLWDLIKTTNAFAIAPLRLPDIGLRNNFNWWDDQYGSQFNWGPRMATTYDWPLRTFYGGLGVPRSDKDKYYLMAKPEVDYSGYETAVNHTAEGWLPPPEYAGVLAKGHAPEMVTSFGPFTLPPGQSRNFTVALVIGENVHYDSQAFREIFDTLNPGPFVDQLDFSDLLENIRWARLVFDNPGVDTDNDGDSGTYFDRFEPETGESLRVFCSGDGIPDFQGAAPPPPPEVRVIPHEGSITVRWNGQNTENFFDPLSFSYDFEGYRVYLSRSRRLSEVMMLASYDGVNFNRHTWDNKKKRFVLNDMPLTLDSLESLYGEGFDPIIYTYSNPFYYGDRVYYFESVDYNMSDLLDPDGIHKLYPDAIKDTSDVDEEGRMRYYEYEYVIENLLPSVPYYVSVSAFDFGHPQKSLDPLESSPVQNQVEVFAMEQEPAILENGKLDVFCYPNPYRGDGNYVADGFENREGDLPVSREQSIWFANLPHKCTISIFSLDGDLVRRLDHDEPQGSGTASVHLWNVISRNTQEVVTGLYYWVVESEYGNQIGKLAIIK